MFYKNKVRKFALIAFTILFLTGMISVAYGYWTDHLSLEGNVDVKMRIYVSDDMINVESTTTDALDILVDDFKVLPERSNEKPDSFSKDSDIPEIQNTYDIYDFTESEDLTDMKDIVPSDESQGSDSISETDSNNETGSFNETEGINSSGDSTSSLYYPSAESKVDEQPGVSTEDGS
jgi:hypothetical protein